MAAADRFRLGGKVALVTGVGRGIGRAIALALAEAGADIAGLYHTRYDDTRVAVEAIGRRFAPVQCDLARASVAELVAAVRQAASALGRLDILVNNAGVIRRAPALEYSEADWDEVVQVDLKAAMFLAQAAARVMIEQAGDGGGEAQSPGQDSGQSTGKIINIASLLSYQGGILVPAYTASKSGLIGLTRALANEWARRGINVNAIAPGYIATDNTAPLRADPDRNAAILARIPAGRWGDPGDLGGAAVFLSAPASDYMHGAVIAVDGGWLAR